MSLPAKGPIDAAEIDNFVERKVSSLCNLAETLEKIGKMPNLTASTGDKISDAVSAISGAQIEIMKVAQMRRIENVLEHILIAIDEIKMDMRTR